MRKEEFQKQFGKDVFAAAILDVTNEEQYQIKLLMQQLAFGGVDIVVNNAGIYFKIIRRSYSKRLGYVV